MKIQSNNLPMEITIEPQEDAPDAASPGSSSSGGIGSQPSSVENAFKAGIQNSFESAINTAGLEVEQQLSLDQEIIASNIGVSDTPDENENTIGSRRDIGKTSGDSSDTPNTQLAARQGLTDFLKASGQDAGQFDEIAQKIFSGDFSLATDQERADGFIKGAGLDGLVNSSLRTDLLAEAETFDMGLSPEYGAGMISDGAAEIKSRVQGKSERVYEDYGVPTANGSKREFADKYENGVVVGSETRSGRNYEQKLDAYFKDGTRVSSEYTSDGKTSTESVTVSEGNTTTTTTTTKNGNTTTTTTEKKTTNPDGTTTTETTTSSTTTETQTSKTGGGAGIPSDSEGSIDPFFGQQIERLKMNLRAAGPQTGSGDIDPDENAQPSGGAFNDEQVHLADLSKFDMIGQPSSDPDGDYFGGRPITAGGGFGPSGDIDWGPDSNQTVSGETRGGDPADITVGNTTLEPTVSSSDEEEED